MTALEWTVRFAVAVVLAGTLVACGSDDDGGASGADDTGTPVATSLSASDLDGSTYESTSVEGHELVEGTTVQVEFEDGSMAVSAGCNTQFGPYDVTDGVLMWTGPAASSMTKAKAGWSRHGPSRPNPGMRIAMRSGRRARAASRSRPSCSSTRGV